MEDRRNLSYDVPPAMNITEECSAKPAAHNSTASSTRASSVSPYKGDLIVALQDEGSDKDEYCSTEEYNGPDVSECSTSAKKLVNSGPIPFEAKKDGINSARELTKKENIQDHNDLDIQAQLEDLKLISDSENDTPMVPQMEFCASVINVPSASVLLPHAHVVSEQLPTILEPYIATPYEPTTSATVQSESVPWVSPSVSSTLTLAPSAPTLALVPEPLQAAVPTANVPLVSVSEDQEIKLALFQQNTAFDLYIQYMNNALEEDALPHNVDDLHEMNFDRSVQSYEACTRGLGHDAVEVGRELLIENLENHLKQLKGDAQNRLEIFKMLMSDEMRNIYNEMILNFILKFSEIAYYTESIKKLDETYAIAIDVTLNTFDLITTDMQEDTNVPRRLLLSEMSSSYKNLKTEICKTTKLLSSAEKNAMDTFELFYTTERDSFIFAEDFVCKSMLEEIAQSAMTNALTGFENDISGLNSAIVNQFRCSLKNDLNIACRKVIESHVVEERSRIFQSYQRNLANPDLNKLENLLLQHSEALAEGISRFRQRTIGFPTQLVNSECVFLQQDMEQELKINKLNFAKYKARELYAVVFELDDNSLENEEVETLAMKLSALREMHKEALGIALESFDLLNCEGDTSVAGTARKELQQEFQLKLNNSLKRTEDRVIVFQFKVATAEARSLYMSMFSEGYSENVTVNVTTADNLRNEVTESAAATVNATERAQNQLENLHVLALSSALVHFNQLTADHCETDATSRRAQLIESLENVYREAVTHQRNQQLDMAENRALEKFKTDLNVAARDSDTWARRRQEVRESSLQQFNQDTSYFGDAAASHLERLLRAMDSSLNLIQNVPAFVGGERECCICMNQLRNTAFQPCGHRCCSMCAPQLSHCPMCRCPINGTLRIY